MKVTQTKSDTYNEPILEMAALHKNGNDRNLGKSNILLFYNNFGKFKNLFNKQNSSSPDNKLGDYLGPQNKNPPNFDSFTSKLKNMFGSSDLNLDKMNKFIKSSPYQKLFYKGSMYLKRYTPSGYNFLNKIFNSNNSKSLSKYIPNSFNPKLFKFSLISRMKKKVRRVIYGIIAIIMFYYLLKYTVHRLTRSSDEKQMRTTLEMVNELKIQNQELIKQQKELLNKFNK